MAYSKYKTIINSLQGLILKKQLILIISLGLANTQLQAMEVDANTRYCQTVGCGWAFRYEERSLALDSLRLLGQTIFGKEIIADPIIECPKCNHTINLIFAKYHTESIKSYDEISDKLDLLSEQSNEDYDEKISRELQPFSKD